MILAYHADAETTYNIDNCNVLHTAPDEMRKNCWKTEKERKRDRQKKGWRITLTPHYVFIHQKMLRRAPPPTQSEVVKRSPSIASSLRRPERLGASSGTSKKFHFIMCGW